MNLVTAGRAPLSMLPTMLDAGRDDDPAIVSDGETTTYGSLRRDVARLAAVLRERGLEPGQRVLLGFPNGPSFFVALLAAWCCGAVVVPIDARSPVNRAMRIARDCEATAILADGVVFSRLEPQLGELPSLRLSVVERPRPSSYPHAAAVLAWAALLDDGPKARPWGEGGGRPEPLPTALLAYTSGSTGHPKGVLLGSEGLLASLEFTRDHLRLAADDRVLVAFPLYHLFSLRVSLAHLLTGATVIAERDLFAGLHRASKTQPTALALVPAACRLIVDRFAPVLREVADGIRRVSVGSAALSPALLGQLRSLLPGATIHIPYGMTEARIGFLDPDAETSERRLLAHDPRLQLRVLDEADEPVCSGVGELVLRGPALTQGYWHQREVDNAAMRRDGLRTRDLMRVAEDGTWSLVGRLDDVLSVGGEKVFPLEVEFALRNHPAVVDARVTGAPDPSGVRGQIVVAHVVLAPDHALDEAALRAYCRQHVEPYKVPTRVQAVVEIPRNAMGKIIEIHRP